MTTLWLILGVFLLTVLSLSISFLLARSAAKAEESLRQLRGDLDALRRFNIEMARKKNTGDDLVASLRARSLRGVQD